MSAKLESCNYDPMHQCDLEHKKDKNYCLACIYDMMTLELAKENLGLLGYHLKMIGEILKDLGYLIPEPIEQRREKNPIAR